MKIKAAAIFFGLFWLAAVFAIKLNAQSYSILHSFVFPAEIPYSPLVQGPDGMLYGTSYVGGNGDYGTVFKVNPNGTGFTNLYNFYGGLDGANPDSGLVLSGGAVFGTATAGGAGGNGTVFIVGTNGGGFSVLWAFSAGGTNSLGTLTNADGADSEAGLILAGGKLFGTTYSGGMWGNGTVFSINTNGAGFTVLRSFSAGNTNATGIYTNADGANPEAGLALAGTNLYGAAYLGGSAGSGTLFKLGTNGTGYTVLKTFPATGAEGGNVDGANPYAGLLISGVTLFGTAENGGTGGSGTVFALGGGGGYTVLKNFSATDPVAGTNTDGANPDGTLLLSGTNLFGTAYDGGVWGNGSVFMVGTNGGGFANLHNFTTGNDGANPGAGLALSGAVLYGTANAGGSWDTGTAFSLGTNGSSYTNFYVFDGTDGVQPMGGLVLSGSAFYGMSFAGGSANNGMIFKLNTNGAAFTVLKSFSAVDPDTGTNSDGANPQCDLVLSGTNLFGTATAGGAGGNGTVFMLGTNGGGFSVLWAFSAGQTNSLGYLTNADGSDPEGGLILSGGNLYGTTYSGGIWGNGTVFSINTNGAGFTVLRSFSAGNTNAAGIYTNADGANPEAGLILSGTNLYGAAYLGGSAGSGTLFKLGTNGAGYTVLKTFSAADPDTGTNSDGANPYTDLMLSGVTLFGTAESGGTGGNGTVFMLGTNGGGFSVLWNFSATDSITGTNTDGANPDGGLLLFSNTLFGTTSAGGCWGDGTMYEINTNGSAFAILHNFDFAADGGSPYADLVLSGNILSGTASVGGVWGGGTVFDLNTTVTSPLLAINGSGAGFIVSWPSPSVGFVLEQNTNLATTNWLNFPGTINDNGIIKSAAINSTSGDLFFRLYYP